MFEFLATAPFGLEGVVADELRELGFENVKAQTGGAVFFGEFMSPLRRQGAARRRAAGSENV